MAEPAPTVKLAVNTVEVVPGRKLTTFPVPVPGFKVAVEISPPVAVRVFVATGRGSSEEAMEPRKRSNR
jgi:hypothetical protein